MTDKKELKEQYKQMKSHMGVLLIRNEKSGKCLIKAERDLKSAANSTAFKLGLGAFPNRELQKEWSELGENYFTISILDELEYSKDESKTDYTEELEMLATMWKDRLAKEQGAQFYEKR